MSVEHLHEIDALRQRVKEQAERIRQLEVELWAARHRDPESEAPEPDTHTDQDAA